MAQNGYPSGSVLEDGKPVYKSEAQGVEHDVEKKKSSGTAKDDPFGDETNSEVKYKVMKWVLKPGIIE